MNLRDLIGNPTIAAKLQDLLEAIAYETRLFRKDLMRRYTCSERCIDQWVSNGTLPPPSGWRGHSPTWRLYDLERCERRNPKLKKALSK